MLRAVGAKVGIYGNDAVEATYPFTKRDQDGQPLDGSKHNYMLTFPAGGLSPVNAVWSIRMYDAKTQLLIQNPIGRYLINSLMLPDMKSNPDGSLTIYIQKDSPGKESNGVARAQRPGLPGDAPILAKDAAALAPPLLVRCREVPAANIPVDDLDRGTPRRAVESFRQAALARDYRRAAEYLDLQYLSAEEAKILFKQRIIMSVSLAIVSMRAPGA